MVSARSQTVYKNIWPHNSDRFLFHFFRFYQQHKYHSGSKRSYNKLWHPHRLCLDYQGWNGLPNIHSVYRIWTTASKWLPYKLHSGMYVKLAFFLPLVIYHKVMNRSRNPTICNIIRWFAGHMGQMTHQPSIWCSKHYFF